MKLFWDRVIFCVLLFINIFIIFAIISYAIGLFWIDTTKYTISSKKVPKSFDGYKILQLSDLHSRSVGRNNEKLLAKVEKENPDIIVLTGDMVNSKDTDFSSFYELIKSLSTSYTVYYIPGNHEQRLPLNAYNSLISTLLQNNVKVLNNKTEYIIKGSDFITIHGFNLPLLYYNNHLKNESHKELTTDTITQSVGSSKENTFNILLSHNPLYFETYKNWGADLTLSGHMHGGIIQLPIIGGLLSPERTLFPQYSAGKYTVEESTLIVNRGLGNSTVNLRVFNNPEISVITLKSE